MPRGNVAGKGRARRDGRRPRYNRAHRTPHRHRASWSMITGKPLNVLQVCDHLGWEGSRMHGVKRLFSWMIPRFDPAAFQVSLVSLRRKDLSEETLEAQGIDISYLHRGRFDPMTL